MSKILTGEALQEWFETAHAYLIDFDEKDWPTELNKYASGITLIPDSIDSLIQGCQFYLSFNEFNTCLSWIASFSNILNQNQQFESYRIQDCVKFLDLYTQFKQLIHRGCNENVSVIAKKINNLIDQNYINQKRISATSNLMQQDYLLDKMDFYFFEDLLMVFKETNLIEQWANLTFILQQDRLKYTIQRYREDPSESQLYSLMDGIFRCYKGYAHYYHIIQDEIYKDVLKQKIEFLILRLSKNINKSALFMLELTLRLSLENPYLKSIALNCYNNTIPSQYRHLNDFEKRLCAIKIERVHLLMLYRKHGMTDELVKKACSNFLRLASPTDETCYSILIQSCFNHKANGSSELINPARYYNVLTSKICFIPGQSYIGELFSLPRYKSQLTEVQYSVLMLLNQIYQKTTMDDYQGNKFGLNEKTLHFFYNSLTEHFQNESTDPWVVEALCLALFRMKNLQAAQKMVMTLYPKSHHFQASMAFTYLFKLLSILKRDGLHIYLNYGVPSVLTATDGERICASYHDFLEWIFTKQYFEFNLVEQLQIDCICLYLNLSTIQKYEKFFKTGEGGFVDINYTGYLEKCNNVSQIADKIYNQFDDYQSTTFHPFTGKKEDWLKLALKYKEIVANKS